MGRLIEVNRLRTPKQCLDELRILDKGTAVTEFFIRQLIKNNEVNHLKAGTKYLVSLESLLDHLGFKIKHNIVDLDNEQGDYINYEQNR